MALQCPIRYFFEGVMPFMEQTKSDHLVSALRTAVFVFILRMPQDFFSWSGVTAKKTLELLSNTRPQTH